MTEKQMEQRRERQRRYRAKHKAKTAEYMKGYYAANKERLKAKNKERSKERYIDDSEKQHKRDYQKRNKDKLNVYRREWRKLHPGYNHTPQSVLHGFPPSQEGFNLT